MAPFPHPAHRKGRGLARAGVARGPDPHHVSPRRRAAGKILVEPMGYVDPMGYEGTGEAHH